MGTAKSLAQKQVRGAGGVGRVFPATTPLDILLQAGSHAPQPRRRLACTAWEKGSPDPRRRPSSPACRADASPPSRSACTCTDLPGMRSSPTAAQSSVHFRSLLLRPRPAPAIMHQGIQAEQKLRGQSPKASLRASHMHCPPLQAAWYIQPLAMRVCPGVRSCSHSGDMAWPLSQWDGTVYKGKAASWMGIITSEPTVRCGEA